MDRVIFACVHNAGRSQMAAAFFSALADPARAEAVSAGTQPGDRIHPEVAETMREAGIDLTRQVPRKLTDDLARTASLLITMGCGDECPVVPGLERDDWPLADPKGQPPDRVREIRDTIRARVIDLVRARGWERRVIRAATLDDLPALTGIYNHYVTHTPVTFDVRTFTPEMRRAWFDDHAPSGRHRLIVAEDGEGRCLGYASSSRWRPKPAYDSTVEVSVYCHHQAVGRGVGTALYRALFALLEQEDVHTLVAGVSLPNAASVALHESMGFRQVGVFHEVGRKFGQLWDVGWFERPMRPRSE